MPISTTHSLTGALLGSGVVTVGFHLNVGTLFQNFFLPLLISPLIAVASPFVLYPLLRTGFRFASVDNQTCVCIGNEAIPAMATPAGFALSNVGKPLRVIVDQEARYLQRLTGTWLGVNVQKLVDYGHYLSADFVSFARGLNDTPKIVALGIIAGALGLEWSIAFMAIVMAVGGVLNAERVAETKSKRITALEADQGCSPAAGQHQARFSDLLNSASSSRLASATPRLISPVSNRSTSKCKGCSGFSTEESCRRISLIHRQTRRPVSWSAQNR
jgi:PiT family inorganic phosphate transporter